MQMITRYADVSNYSMEDVIILLENKPLKLFKWFIGNSLEANDNKYYQISLI